MALATQHFKGSCSTYTYAPSSWNRGSKVKHSLPAFDAGWTEDRSISLKCRLCSSIGASPVLRLKSKLTKISAFKGNSQYDDSGNGTKTLKDKDARKVSYLRNRNEESLVESSEVQNSVSTPLTASGGTTIRPLAVNELFKNWLMLLRTPSRTQPVDEVVEVSPSSITSEMANTKQERGEIVKSVWWNFLGVDATIKIPLLLFTPLYFAVSLIYGSKVSKELTPLWILGPLIFALYTKTFRLMCGLYAFTFKQTVKIVKNVPAYCLLVRNYVFHGKLNEETRTRSNMNYNDWSRRKMKDLQGWFLDIGLDLFESIWPFYYRTKRIVKRANFFI